MKILYLMHVNWHWIRQRPHVLAEQLAQRHEVRVMHYAMYRRAHRAGEAPAPASSHVLHRLPGRLKCAVPGLERLDRAWIAHQVSAEASRFAPDLLWLTHPDFEAAAQAGAAPRIVYDCMDDHLAFHAGTSPELAGAEARLVERAELTIFSSATLAERVRQRSQPCHSLVVNNGIDEALCRCAAAPAGPARSGRYTLGYFGTISHWFDWPLALQLLKALPAVELVLAGPVETALPAHPRIRHVGILAHARLGEFSAGCDALVMPFRLTPLIEAVNPVKLYEYVAFGRPALAPRYAESEPFAPLVTLYRDAAEAIALVTDWLAPGSHAVPDRAAAAAFLQVNTWHKRGAQILAALS